LLISELTGTISPFTHGIFAFAISTLALQIRLVRSKRFRTEIIDGLLCAVVCVITLSVLYYALYMHPSPALAQISLVSLYLRFPLV
jgi:hypothetical protein